MCEVLVPSLEPQKKKKTNAGVTKLPEPSLTCRKDKIPKAYGDKQHPSLWSHVRYHLLSAGLPVHTALYWTLSSCYLATQTLGDSLLRKLQVTDRGTWPHDTAGTCSRVSLTPEAASNHVITEAYNQKVGLVSVWWAWIGRCTLDYTYLGISCLSWGVSMQCFNSLCPLLIWQCCTLLRQGS
jgi:hypothetical protein